MESISLDLSEELLLAGDLAFFSSLFLLVFLSWGAAQEIAPEKKITMQWGFNGKPIWQANRRFGLMFTPVVASICGLILSFFAHFKPMGINPGLTIELLNISIIRVAMAVAFVFAHLIHLSVVIKETKN